MKLNREVKLEFFLNNPGERCEIKERLLNDIGNANNRLYITAYSLEADNFINAINELRLQEKFIILNEDKKVAKLNQSIQATITGINWSSLNLLMHNKFIIIDNIVWTGSFNLSNSAIIKNWENMIRIEDEEIANEYVNYFNKLYVWGKGIISLPQLIYSPSKLICPQCKCNIDDIMEHYHVINSNGQYSYKCIRSMSNERAYCTECNQNKKLSELIDITNYGHYCYDCYIK